MSILSGVSAFFGLDIGTTAIRLVELQRQIDAVRQAIDGLSWIPGAGRWARV